MGSLEASTNHMPRDVSLVRIGSRRDAVAIVRHLLLGGGPSRLRCSLQRDKDNSLKKIEPARWILFIGSGVNFGLIEEKEARFLYNPIWHGGWEG